VSDKTPSELRLVRSPAPGSAQGPERGSSRGSEPGPARSPASGSARGPKLELVKSSEAGSAKAPVPAPASDPDPERGSGPGSGSGSAKSAAAKGAAMAREKLAQAKSDAARRGQLPRREPRRKAYGPRRDSGDPQLFGRAIADLLADRGWEQPAAVGGVFGRWHEIVGPDMAAHTTPETFADGEVLVVADSTAWATQVRLLARTLVRRLNEELGDGTVQRVKVRGPQNGPRPSGGLRVTGSRGPGDTYG
jgi:predicted nucleic acid-binding Zn ribbon protein